METFSAVHHTLHTPNPKLNFDSKLSGVTCIHLLPVTREIDVCFLSKGNECTVSSNKHRSRMKPNYTLEWNGEQHWVAKKECVFQLV